MLFPTTPILDTFDRANEGPPPSANWNGPVFAGNTGISVVSNQAVAGAGTASTAWWSAEQFDRNCEAYVTVIDATIRVGLFLRLTSPGVASSQDSYQVQWNPAGPRVTINRIDDGAATQILAIEGATLSNGDALGGSVIGDLITAYKKPSGGSWELLDSVTDGTYSTDGFIGLQIFLGGTADDFGGGDALVSMKITTLLFAGS